MNIQWYPGHMTKTRRMLEAELSSVDAVCEVVDARIPAASRNPDVDAIAGRLPRLIALNRVDQADPPSRRAGVPFSRGKGTALSKPTAGRARGQKGFRARRACNPLRKSWSATPRAGRTAR